jgi:hypothetical protein
MHQQQVIAAISLPDIFLPISLLKPSQHNYIKVSAKLYCCTVTVLIKKVYIITQQDALNKK